MLDVQGAADHCFQPRVVLRGAGNIEFGFVQIPDARREAKSQHVHQREHVVRKAGGADRNDEV